MRARMSLFVLLLGVAVSSASAADPSPEVAKLIAQLKDPNEGTRLKAAKELGKHKAEAREAIPTLSKLATDDPDEDVRAVAKRALAAIREAVGEMDKDKDKEALVPYVKALKSRKAAERVEALERLTEMGEKAKSGAAAIAEAMLDPNEAVRDKAAGCMEKVDPGLHKHLVTMLYDKDSAKVRSAIVELGKMGARGRGAVPVLKWRYSTPTKGLGTGPGRIWFEALESLAQVAPDDPLVVNEVLKLVALPPAKAGGAGDQTNVARGAALRSLNAIEAPNKKKVEALIAALADSRYRIEAIERLGKFGADAKPALPALMKLKLDKAETVREAATKAVELIQAE